MTTNEFLQGMDVRLTEFEKRLSELVFSKGEGLDRDQWIHAGAALYDKIPPWKEDLKNWAANHRGEEQETIDSFVERLISLINKLLVDVFDTKPEEVQSKVKKYAEEVND